MAGQTDKQSKLMIVEGQSARLGRIEEGGEVIADWHKMPDGWIDLGRNWLRGSEGVSILQGYANEEGWNWLNIMVVGGAQVRFLVGGMEGKDLRQLMAEWQVIQEVRSSTPTLHKVGNNCWLETVTNLPGGEGILCKLRMRDEGCGLRVKSGWGGSGDYQIGFRQVIVNNEGDDQG